MTTAQAENVAKALGQRFSSEVEFEKFEGDRYQFIVVSPQFAGMTHLQRQDKIWALLDEILSDEEKLDVALVLTFATGEINEWIEGLA